MEQASTNIEAIGYNGNNRELHVHFFIWRSLYNYYSPGRDRALEGFYSLLMVILCMYKAYFPGSVGQFI